MKELKLSPAVTIFIAIFAAIAIGGLITVAVLPDSSFSSNGNAEDGAIGKIVLCCGLALFALILVVCIFVSNKKEKEKIERLNKTRESLGDTALFFEGKAVDPEQAKENAKKNAASVAGGVIFAAIFGFGFFRISHNNTARTFIVHDNGLFVVNRQTMQAINYKIDDLRRIKTELRKNGQVSVKLPNTPYHFILNTKKTEVTPEWLQNRLIELSQKPTEVAETPFEEA